MATKEEEEKNKKSLFSLLASDPVTAQRAAATNKDTNLLEEVGKGISSAAKDVGGAISAAARATAKAVSNADPVSAARAADGMDAGRKFAPTPTNPSSAAGKKAFEIERVGMYQQSKANQAALNQPMSEEVANVMADIDMARAETGLGRESEDSPAAPEAPAAPEGANDFLAAQEDFNEKFGGSLGRPEEGETGDQYEARLKQRNVERNAARKELAKLKPQGAAPATPDERVADTGGESTGIGFDDQAIDPDAGGFKAPTISPQASSSARATASNAPTVITDPKERLKGRQEFGSYLENQLKRSGGNYTFNNEDRSRATSLGVGRKEMDNFMNKLGRRDEEEEPRRRRRLGQIGGNKFGA